MSIEKPDEGRLSMAESPRTERESKLSDLRNEIKTIIESGFGQKLNNPVREAWLSGKDMEATFSGERLKNPDGSVGITNIEVDEEALGKTRAQAHRLLELLDEVEKLK